MCRSVRYKRNVSADVNKFLRHLTTTSRTRAGRIGVPFTITPTQIRDLWKKQGGRCAISGVVMTHAIGDGTILSSGYNASIDRIDSAGGYTPNNVQLVCGRVNYMKSNMDNSDFSWWIRTIYECSIQEAP